MDLFRYADSKSALKPFPPTSLRPPSNVPYVVDNLWEWTRPAHYPSRRACAFASPSRTDAVTSAKGPWADGMLYQVHFADDAHVVQLAVKDAADHPDAGSKGLRRLLFRLLDQLAALPKDHNWAGLSLDAKRAAAPLFVPCLSAGEVEAILGAGGPLEAIGAELRAAVTFWASCMPVNPSAAALPNPDGEVFYSFELPHRFTLSQLD